MTLRAVDEPKYERDLSAEDRRLLHRDPSEIRPVKPEDVPLIEDVLIAVRRYLDAGTPGMPSAGAGALRSIDRLLDDVLRRV